MSRLNNTRARGMPRRIGIAGDRQVRERSATAKLTHDKLPLVHVTSVWAANEIVTAGKLETRHCKVFRRDLIYFFVLRPAYKDKHSDEKSHQLTRFPVVLILNPEAVEVPFHVYPFDTGAAVSGAFGDQADPYVPLEDYELEPTHAAAAGHIAWAFKTPLAYFDGQLRHDILADVPDFESVTRGFVDVARMGRAGSNQHDKRASAIEVAVSHDLDLKGSVLFAVLPKQYLEAASGPNAMLLARLAELDIEHQFYNWQPNTAPREFQDTIGEICRIWLGENGWL